MKLMFIASEECYGVDVDNKLTVKATWDFEINLCEKPESYHTP